MIYFVFIEIFSVALILFYSSLVGCLVEFVQKDVRRFTEKILQNVLLRWPLAALPARWKWNSDWRTLLLRTTLLRTVPLRTTLPTANRTK